MIPKNVKNHSKCASGITPGLSPATFTKPWFSFFTPHTTKSQNQAKTPKSPNLAIHQPHQDQFLLFPNFSHITFYAFVRFEPNHFSETIIFIFYPTHHQVTKSSQNTKIIKLGYAPTMPRWIPFAPKHFPHHFRGIFEVWVQPHFQNHDFRFSTLTPPTKIQKSPNLAKHKPFCPQIFPNHFGGIWEDWVHPVLPNHDFRFSPFTPPSHKI